MKRTVLIFLVAVMLVMGLCTLANAFLTSEKIIVANSLVAIARAPAGGLSADQRIDAVNERLAYILGYEPLTQRSIYVKRIRGESAIMVGNKLLVTVTKSDATANHTTVDGLAKVWLKYAQTALPEARPRASISE